LRFKVKILADENPVLAVKEKKRNFKKRLQLVLSELGPISD